jgi:hypothetical protein
MHGEIASWNNGLSGISLGLSVPEIDRLIVLLRGLRDDPEQHFHISSDGSGTGGIGDIEIYVTEPGSPANLRLSGIALAPGRESAQNDV